MAMTEPSPLAPPAPAEPALTLTAPEAPKAVAATAAPRMAPAVPAAALPGLDQKVDAYLTGLLGTATSSPDFTAKANDVRTMGDDEIRRAAETSNRMLGSPVKALQEGGLSEGTKVGGTLLELRRTVEALDPKGAQGARKIFGMIPMGDRLTDYFRRYQSAQSHLNAIMQALYDGQDELRRDNAALNQEKQQLGHDGPPQPVRLHRGAARRPGLGEHRRARRDGPREGQGDARGRAVLRAAEAPGPADAACRLDPELPRHRR